MKKLILFVLFATSFNFLFATTYYFNGTADGLITFASGVYSNWGQNADGSAGVGRPTTLLNVGDTFIVTNIPNATVYSCTVNFTIGGTIVIGDVAQGLPYLALNTGGTIAASTLNIISTSRLVLNIATGYSGITLGTLDNASMVNYNFAGDQTVLPGNYGKLRLNNTGIKTLSSGTANISNSLDLFNGGTPTTVFETTGTAAITGNFVTSTNNIANTLLRVGSTIATPVTAGRTYAFGVSYNADASQTVMDGAYTNLTIEGGVGTQKIKTHINNANSSISGVLSINDLSTFLTPNGGFAILSGAFTTASSTPTTALLNIGSDAASPISSGKTYNFNVEYSSSGYAEPQGGTFNQNFTISGLNNNNGQQCGSQVFNILGNFSFLATYSGGNFYAQTSTFNLAAAGAQTLPAQAFYNVTLSNSGVKTLTGSTVNGKLSMQGTATASVAPTYGTAASLEYNTATARNSGVEWITPFLATSGVLIDNTGIVTLNEAKVFGANTNVPLNIKLGATLASANFGLTFHGDFINTGTLTAGSSPVVITGTTAAHNIAGFTTTGQISMTKSSGKALVTGNWPISGTGSFPILINGSGTGTLEFSNYNSINTTGFLNIQGGLIRLNDIEINVPLASDPPHIHQVGSLTQTGGTLDFSDKNFNPNLHVVLNVSGDFSRTSGVFQTSNSASGGSFSLVQFNGITQNIQCTTPYANNTELTYYVAAGSTCTLAAGSNFNLSSGYESFNVRDGGTLICGVDAVINGGPGYFTVSDGATLKTGNIDGINSSGSNGSAQTGTRYFSSLANYEYNGTAAQTTGVFTTVPTAETVNSLILSNTATSPNNVVTAQQNFTVTNACNFNAGIFSIAAFTVTLNGTLSSTASSGFRANGLSNMVIGGTGALGSNLFFDATNIGKSRGADADGSLGDLTPGTTNNVRNFTLNRAGETVTLGNEMQVNNTLTPTAGTLASGGNLVMLSTDASTSSILALEAGASITGDVVVQSFFKGGTVAANRGYRMIASPTANTTTFFPQIKERFIVTCVEGPVGGCDFRPVQQPNAQTLTNYNEPGLTKGAASFNNINHTGIMEIGRGYYFFFRGSRANLNETLAGKINQPFVVPEDWTAAFTGSINSGDIAVPVTKTTTTGDDVSSDGLNLIGNPYPAVLNFTSFRDDALNNTVIDDYVMIMKRDRTGFFSYSGGVLNGGTLTAIESAGAIPGTAQYPFIQSGQAFFVRKTADGGPLNVTFKETHKAAGVDSKKGLRTLDNEVKETPLKRQLIRFNIKSETSQDDATIVLEDGNSANWGGNDAPYMANNTIYTYSLTADGMPAAINFMPSVSEVKEIKLFVESTKSNANLTLNFTELTGAGKNEVWLRDNYLVTETQITPTNNSYTFSVEKSIKATSGKNRFVLFFVPKIEYEVKLNNFTAKPNNVGVQLNWESKTEINSSKYELQRSMDGIVFETIYTQLTKAVGGNSNEILNYSFVDKTAQTGELYYRLKMIMKDETFTNSEVKTVGFTFNEVNSLIIYPNVVKDELNMRWKSQNNEIFNLEIYNVMGKMVLNYKNLKVQSYTTNVSHLNAGGYIVKIKNQKTNQLITIRKFVKY